LYFLGGPRISIKDLMYMKKLQKYTNIIPIIARGDTYTIDEIREIKMNLIKDAHDYKINWFDFSEALRDSSQKLKELNEGTFGPCPPFLIISSVNKFEIAPNQFVYGRKYSWGVCNIENPTHSDFLLLYHLLGGHICLECIKSTDLYYKNYSRRIKEEKKKRSKDNERKRSLGIGAMLALGLIGTVMTIKKKLF